MFVLQHPKKNKICAFCKSFDQNAIEGFASTSAGYKVNTGVRGKCLKQNGMFKTSGAPACPKYAPSVDAEKLL